MKNLSALLNTMNLNELGKILEIEGKALEFFVLKEELILHSYNNVGSAMGADTIEYFALRKGKFFRAVKEACSDEILIWEDYQIEV